MNIEMEKLDIQIPGTFTHIDISKADTSFIVAGYASVDIVDKQNDRVNLDAIEEAFNRMMSIKERRNLNLQHSNIQIGRILPQYIDSSGRLWKSGRDHLGIFIVADIFDDIKKGRDIRQYMSMGHYLAFSIGGQALSRKTVCDEKHCWSDILKMDLFEITLCENPVNTASRGFILNKEDMGCFINIAKMDKNSDKFINKNVNLAVEEKTVSDPNKGNPTPEKTDLQIVLDTLGILKKEIDALKPEPEPEPEPLTEERVMELIKAALEEVNKKEPEPEPEPEPQVIEKEVEKIVYKFEEPVKEDFEEEEDFEKAMNSYKAFKEELSKELEKELGKIIPGPVNPPKTPTEDTWESILGKFDESGGDLRSMIFKMEAEK